MPHPHYRGKDTPSCSGESSCLRSEDMDHEAQGRSSPAHSNVTPNFAHGPTSTSLPRQRKQDIELHEKFLRPDVVVLGDDLVLINHSLVLTDHDLVTIHRHVRKVLRPWRRDMTKADEPEPQYSVVLCRRCSLWANEPPWEADEPPHLCGSELRSRYMMDRCRRCAWASPWRLEDLCCAGSLRASFVLHHGRWRCREWHSSDGEAVARALAAKWAHIRGALWRLWMT